MVGVRDIRKLMLDDEFDRRAELLALGADAVEPLKRLARSGREKLVTRQRAIFALGELGAEGATRTLQDLLRADEPVIRLFAARALTKIMGEEAAEDLEPLLEDPDLSVCKVAMHCLGATGARKALAALERIRAAPPHEALGPVAADAIEEIRKRFGA